MNCLLIFDHLNDIIYTKFDDKFAKHITEFAAAYGFQSEVQSEGCLDSNIIVQMFSPIITSHRIMNCQFGNSYTSIQCEDNLSMHFDEYMGYLFVLIGNENQLYMKRLLNVCVTMVRYLCGPDVYQLKAKEDKTILLNNVIDSWASLHQNNQTTLVEAIEQLFINSDLSSSTIKALKESVDKLSSFIECNRIHALILVQNKFLSLYSSQNAKELSAADIVFSTILCETVRDRTTISSYQVLLSGPEQQPKCLPHVMHILPLSEGIHLIYLIEIGNAAVAASLYETFCHLHTMQQVQIQREKETLQPAFENLDLATRRLNESLKKTKNSQIENSHKQLMKKWDVIKKKYQEYLKNASDEALLRAETLALGFLENLKELLSLTSVDSAILQSSVKSVKDVANGVQDKLATYDEFLKAKGIQNFSLGSSDSLTVNKYLEEFPGLVHFIYIDRTTHRVTTPTLDFSSEEGEFTKIKIWSMVNFTREHVQEGNMSLMWKDSTFNYAYFLWFEDSSGAPLKPANFPTSISLLPGILCEDFYYKLKELCFPKMSPNKIRCYELFCIHLGLVTASCVLEQTRRLSATIWELRGHPSHAIDLL
ncbi:unnamed protein product [Acanthoscelides obtectus]|uniref:Hermansky-Pudlak syndrome 1 protein homolog n=1 Tax=Acanthoscelides obtectus TaxID=200917 RepID=A0A9P0P3I6_ACAOB|nr:unnamed protein product [Acanthoscelides obtectus]CAK1654000.1 Hermansky-Pudlak syndrome 1 protein [Acanthoscelides obtectus]